MTVLSIADIQRSQDECIDLDMWVHPNEVTGYDVQSARSAALERSRNSSPDDDFVDSPDTIISDYLKRCLDRRSELLMAGSTLPPGLQVSPLQYIDALTFMILELESAYACYGLGATVYQDDRFLGAEYAKEILERLRSALFSASNSHQWDMIRDLILEVFRISYPWSGKNIRYEECLDKSDRDFLTKLLESGPRSGPNG